LNVEKGGAGKLWVCPTPTIISTLTDFLQKINDVNDLINATNVSGNQVKYQGHLFTLSPYERFNYFIKQLEIVDNIQRTTQINAPAGFGKTLLGLLWNFRRGRKLIWVCPRNIVAESVYKSINEELDNFGIDFLSTELYLSGEVQQSNELFNGDFKSDIIMIHLLNFRNEIFTAFLISLTSP
jgi:hypothetical protein